MHCITAEISLGALRENVRLLRERIGPAVKFCAVVKADAYGHGLDLLAGPIEQVADWLAVCTPEEAVALRRLGVRKPILALFSPHAVPGERHREEALDTLIREEVVLTVGQCPAVDVIRAATERTQKAVTVHVKIDTGMQRAGVLPDEVPDLLARLRAEPRIRLGGVCTHFATADESDRTPLVDQLACFHQALSDQPLPSDLIRHAAASAAVIDLPETHLDMVRVGLALYGCAPAEPIRERVPLRPILRLTAPLMQIKAVRTGTRTGYGLAYTFPSDTSIGLVPIGYGDGYPRCLSNRSMVSVRGTTVPLRGRVSMDQIVIDLGEVPDAELGDEVEIISPDPAAPHSAENLARLAGTIPYEILCAVGTTRVQRVPVE